MTEARRTAPGPGSRRSLAAILAVALVALLARLAFVCWSTTPPSGDAGWYHSYAQGIAAGVGYVNPDSSPANLWMPGWPTLLAGLYVVFDVDWKVGVAANVLLGTATVVLLAVLAARLFGAGIGLAAAGLYAIWPGNIYFAATLMTETAFNFSLVLCLTLLVHGVEAERRRTLWAGGAGIALGLAALIRPEPLVIVPVALLFLAVSLRRARAVLASGGVLLIATGVTLAPWIVRNHSHFGRIMLTSASGGSNAWLGNHSGATGGENFQHADRFRKRHAGDTLAETNLATDAAGWREAWEFVRAHPGEEVGILLSKLRLTYGADDGALGLLRRIGGRPYLDLATVQNFTRLADGFWYAILLLAVIGLAAVRSWRPAARVLVLGWLVAWLAVQLVFLGGPRFHMAQTPALAIVAAVGLDVVRRGLRDVRRSPPLPLSPPVR